MEDTTHATARQIRQMWDDGLEETREQRRNYWIAYEFLRGNQWLVWSDVTERLTPITDDDIIRHVNNRLGPATRTIMAKLHRRPLSFEVPLTATDDGSIQGSKLSEAVLSHTAREQDWERVRRKANRLAWKGGTGLICQEWDTDAAGTLGLDPVTNEEVGKGDIKLTALSITEAVTEPGCDDIEHAPYWIKCSALPPKTVQRIYDLDEAPNADSTDASTYDVRSPWGRDGLKGRLCSVLTLFERPSKQNPQGQVVTVCGDIELHRGPWPYPFDDRLNVVAITETEQEGRWNGDSVLWDAIPLQFELNRAHTNISEHIQKVGFAQRMAPQGVLDETDFDNDPATIIEYAAGPGMPAPGYLAPPQLADWVQKRPEDLYRAIDDTLGVHDISRGSAPSGVESGVALSLLAEQDDTPVGGLAKVSGEAWGRVGRNTLEMYAAFVHGERREALVQQPNASPEVVQWDGTMLAGQTMAEVPPDVTSPRSRAAQTQTAMNLWDRNVFVTPEGKPDPVTFLAFADMPGTTDALEASSPALLKYRRQNADMFAGHVCVPVDFDDHALAIKVHNQARFSRRYEQSPPEIRALFDLKIQGHQNLSEEEMVMQEARAAVAPALAVAAQAHEPAIAGEAEALANLQAPPPEQGGRGPNAGGADAPTFPDLPEPE